MLGAQYLMDMAVYRGQPELLIFPDETGADRRDNMRRFGSTLRRKPARAQKLLLQQLLQYPMMVFCTATPPTALILVIHFVISLSMTLSPNCSHSMV